MSSIIGQEKDRLQREKDALEKAKNLLENEEEQPFDFKGEDLVHSLSGVYKFIEETLNRDTLWTMGMVEELEELSKRLPEMKGGEAYNVTGFDGKCYTLRVPDMKVGDYLEMQIVGHQVLSQILDEHGRFKTDRNR
jgi:uncharacterized protein (DUF342 family)